MPSLCVSAAPQSVCRAQERSQNYPKSTALADPHLLIWNAHSIRTQVIKSWFLRAANGSLVNVSSNHNISRWVLITNDGVGGKVPQSPLSCRFAPFWAFSHQFKRWRVIIVHVSVNEGLLFISVLFNLTKNEHFNGISRFYNYVYAAFVGYHCSIKGTETCFCSLGLECNILMSCAVFPFDTEQERKRPAIVWVRSSFLREQMVTLCCGRHSLNINWHLYFPAISTHSLCGWMGPAAAANSLCFQINKRPTLLLRAELKLLVHVPLKS